MSKNLAYWKSRCISARNAAESNETKEFRDAYKFAQRKVEQLERKLFRKARK